MARDTVSVVRAGRLVLIEAASLQLGDIVFIQAGEVVPADLQLVEVDGLAADEFDLTGELLPVSKTTGGPEGMLYRGSRVMRGAGQGVVMATGADTEFGKTLEQAPRPDRDTVLPRADPLPLALLGLSLPGMVLVLVRGHQPTVLLGLLLVLPMLALLQRDGPLRRMVAGRFREALARQGVRLQEPQALERLEKVDLFCFDKTGVLTSRHMTVKKIRYADGACRASLPGEEGASALVGIACALGNPVRSGERLDLAFSKVLASFLHPA
jgi:magnesium-transporting ATPase (P-type)